MSLNIWKIALLKFLSLSNLRNKNQLLLELLIIIPLLILVSFPKPKCDQLVCCKSFKDCLWTLKLNSKHSSHYLNGNSLQRWFHSILKLLLVSKLKKKQPKYNKRRKLNKKRKLNNHNNHLPHKKVLKRRRSQRRIRNQRNPRRLRKIKKRRSHQAALRHNLINNNLVLLLLNSLKLYANVKQSLLQCPSCVMLIKR